MIIAPSRTITLTAVVVHFGPVDKKKPEAGHLMGARITDAGGPQHSHLVDFLNSLDPPDSQPEDE